MFKQLLVVIASYPKNAQFSITTDWLNANGIVATPSDAKRLGIKFAKVYAQHGCISLGKGTDNHILYKKI